LIAYEGCGYGDVLSIYVLDVATGDATRVTDGIGGHPDRPTRLLQTVSGTMMRRLGSPVTSCSLAHLTASPRRPCLL
jgi:hypothetical protein